jgi:tRNA(Ile)-lysidine synthase
MAAGLPERLLEHLTAAGLFPRPGLALVAVSGGPDSVALLDLMWSVREALQLELAVAHIVHGISAEATAFVPHVAQLARLYGLEFHKQELALGPAATETSARQARYRALRSIQKAAGAAYLVTAHQRDDQVETVLYRFLRGTGVAGLAGIPASGPGGLVRPLLPFSRAELEEWLARQFPDPSVRPPLFDDPANADVRHDRSWVRHRLLPALRSRFGPGLDSRLLDVSAYAARDNAAWVALLRGLSELDFSSDSGAVEVARAPLQRYDKLLSEAILSAVMRTVGCRLAKRRMAALRLFAANGASGRTMELGSGFKATLVFDKLRVERAGALDVPDAQRLVFCEGCQGRLSWGGWEFSWRSEEAGASRRDSVWAWITYGPCEVRAPRAGDRIRPLGGVGSRRLRRLLMEARVPERVRKRFPVISRGADVLWVPGVCRSVEAVPSPGEPAVRLEARGG